MKVVVPGAPSALKRRALPRVHPSPCRVRPSSSEMGRRLIGSGDEQRIDLAMSPGREDDIIKNRTRNYSFRSRDGESRKRTGRPDESRHHTLGPGATFDNGEEL